MLPDMGCPKGMPPCPGGPEAKADPVTMMIAVAAAMSGHLPGLGIPISRSFAEGYCSADARQPRSGGHQLLLQEPPPCFGLVSARAGDWPTAGAHVLLAGQVASDFR